MLDARAPSRADDTPTSVLAEISREMVRLYKEQFGRGPTKTRTNFAGLDIVIERHLDRKVRAFVSGIDTRQDVSSEIFYLEAA